MNEDMVEAVFDWISEMRAGNLRFITEVPNISLPHLEAWSHIKAWSEIITFEIEALASIRGNTVHNKHLKMMHAVSNSRKEGEGQLKKFST